MGLRGPAPKPNVVKLLQGNPGRRPINLSDGVNPDVEIPDKPQWLNKHAVKEWNRVTVELERLGLIAKIDRAMIAEYCQVWGMLCQLELAFAAQQREALRQGAEQGMDLDIAIVSPFVSRTPTGFTRESSIFRVMSHLRAQVVTFQAHFGMSPSARMRVQASDGQMALPGIEAAPELSGVHSLRSFA